MREEGWLPLSLGRSAASFTFGAAEHQRDLVIKCAAHSPSIFSYVNFQLIGLLPGLRQSAVERGQAIEVG